MERLDRFAPPGMGTSGIRNWTIGAMIVSAFFSLSFLTEYATQMNELRREMEYAVYHGLTMPRFSDLIVFPMLLFRLSVVVPLLQIPGNYLYFYQETKSIYVMKRLHRPAEMHLRCLILPIFGAVLTVVAGCTVYCLYLLYYLAFTPEIFLPATL